MVSLGQKLKMPKTCEKPFYKIIRIVLCKKPLEKRTNIGEKRQFRKSAMLQRLCSPCKVYSLCKMVNLGQKLKMPKTCKKTMLQDYLSCSVQKTARKNTKYCLLYTSPSPRDA